MKIDLHLHSVHSDGKFKPAEVARRVAKAGVKIASLTDHDTVDGAAEFNQAARRLGLTTINGVEISSYWKGVGLHILGFGINVKSAALKKIFKAQSKERRRVFLEAVKLFERAGFAVDKKKLERFKKIKTLVKPHLFGLIYGVAKNRELAKKKYKLVEGERPMGAFINTFTSLPGQLAYVKKKGISCAESIRAIHQAGGLAVLAHPGIEIEFRRGKFKVLDAVKDLIKDGLDGLEAFYSSVSGSVRTVNFYTLAKKHQLIVTAGSDDHDGSRVGTIKVDPKTEKELIKALGNAGL